MAALVISISSDVSVESVRSSFLRVILIGSIFVEVPVAPEVRAAAVASHVEDALAWYTQSSSETPWCKSRPISLEVCPIIYNGSTDDIRVVTGILLSDHLLDQLASDGTPISPRISVLGDIETDVLVDIEADATAEEVVVDRDVEAGVDAGIGMEVDVRVDIEDEVESSDRGTIEVRVDVVAEMGILDEDIETRQRELEAMSLIDGGKRASLLEHVASLERGNARLRGTMMMERARADRFWRHVSFMERA
ncbi:hypothetical protein Tco_0150871 [Tanacetum coccineum]